MAISVLRVVPHKEAEEARHAAANALTARLEAEENAERARLAAEGAIEAQRAAEEAVEQARLAAEETEAERIADKRIAEQAKRAADDAVQAWRATLTAEDRLLPTIPAAELRAAGLGLEDALAIEPEETEPPVLAEVELHAAEEQPVTTELTCKIAFWRGYFKGAFYARAFDEDGNEVALAESPQFKPRGKEVPERTDEAVAAYKALVTQLEEAGWEVEERDGTWFGQIFRRPL